MVDGRGGPRPGPHSIHFELPKGNSKHSGTTQKFEIRNSESEIRNSELGIRNPFEEILLLYSETIIFV